MQDIIIRLMAPGLGTELIYSFVIILCSLMVYFGTKELDELSSYKAIRYFRYSFLFFAIAYFFRSFIKFVIVSCGAHEIMEISPILLGVLSLFLFVYFSSMAIFYLSYSLKFKDWKNHQNNIYIFHILALLIAITSIFLSGIIMYFLLNLALFAFTLYVIYTAYRNNKSKNKGMYVVYVLLLIFWILNIIDVLVPDFLQVFQLTIYMVSIGIFLTILYKVLKKVGN